MVEPWSEEFATHTREWCDKVAVLGVDVLVNAGLVAKGEVNRASHIIAEELFVRLCLHDYPPIPESLTKVVDTEPNAAPER